ncbi:hypothetical protein ACM44_09945 [Chryseobacterium koreense CCUG 49689]|uniref:Uncharacterized protein n=1 Tax=Chryseobacterium koreense CCUG 49689 TaxID=1304281 RepID=A0A0J7IYN9_9FLAO|nr:hypothetical protein ACM44_09945 [Chryseobacterium koreense CCUG 49689]
MKITALEEKLQLVHKITQISCAEKPFLQGKIALEKLLPSTLVPTAGKPDPSSANNKNGLLLFL